jgi:hypothetical protein
MMLETLVLFTVMLFVLLAPVLLIGGLMGAAVPATRRSALGLLRGGLFGGMASAALYILVSLVLGHRLEHMPANSVLAAAALGFSICALIAFTLVPRESADIAA